MAKKSCNFTIKHPQLTNNCCQLLSVLQRWEKTPLGEREIGVGWGVGGGGWGECGLWTLT